VTERAFIFLILVIRIANFTRRQTRTRHTVHL